MTITAQQASTLHTLTTIKRARDDLLGLISQVCLDELQRNTLQDATHSLTNLFKSVYPKTEEWSLVHGELIDDLARALAEGEITLPDRLATRVSSLGLPF